MAIWTVRDYGKDNFFKDHGTFHPLLEELLSHRGVTNKKEALDFLEPNYDTSLHDPFLLKDMDRAVERILSAIDKKEKILVYSDYDADGIPGAVMFADFFRRIGYDNFSIYIPHRHHEGYGLNLEAIDEFKKSGVSLIITIDCGIADHDEVIHAMNEGIDVIVTDHHLPQSQISTDGMQNEWLPPAYAVVNPKQSLCEYPYDGLCGTGVAFKLIQAILARNRFGLKEGTEKWFLDMVGIATLSDMVPLVGENRTLASYGLKVLRKSQRPGLEALLRTMKLAKHTITEDDIGFSISPRINAASRMGVPMDAFTLLSTTDNTEASRLATHLDSINNERKGIVASIVKDIKRTLKERVFEEKPKVIVVGNPKWRPALLGLAANTIAEEYGCPVFVWGREDGEFIKGSCRSGSSLNLVHIMEKAKDAFLEFGGHAYSGGFSVSHDNIHNLENILIQAVENIGSDDVSDAISYVDKMMSLNDVSPATWNIISQLAPFGVANHKPIFLFADSEVKQVKLFGKEKNHLELSMVRPSGGTVSAISFFSKGEDFGKVPEEGKKINLVATMEKSLFGRAPSIRLRIEDIF